MAHSVNKQKEHIKCLLNDIDDTVLFACTPQLFDAFGSTKEILQLLIQSCTEEQLNTISNVIQNTISESNKLSHNHQIQCNVAVASNESVTSESLTSMIKHWQKHTNDISVKQQTFLTQSSAVHCQYANASNFEHCGCTQRLIIIFKHVNQCHVDVSKIVQIFAKLNDYSVQDFVNDLDHIRMCHNTQVSQQIFCKQLSYCNWAQCKFKDTKHVLQMMETHQIAPFKFIQEAHLYLFHSIPMISDTADSNEIQQLMRLYNNYSNHRSSRFIDKYCDRIQRNSSQSLLNLHSPSMSAINIASQTPETDSKEEDMLDSPLFSCGTKFEYNLNKNCKKNPNYVGCAYENLKEELLKDSDKDFSLTQWNILIEASTILLNIPYSKQLQTKDGKHKPISLGRIVAVRLYCSHGLLASALKNTYRQSKHVSKAQQKKKHSRLSHWAKLLSTTCDLFGQFVCDSEVFYRGLNAKYIFKSGFSQKLYGPISTTRHIGVAAAFAGEGIILQIEKASHCGHAKFFECNPYSPYKSEQELLFDGNNYLDVTAVKTNLGFTHFDTKSMLLLQALTSKCEINIQTLVRRSPDIIGKLCDLLNNNSSDYLSETVTYYLRSLKKLYIRIQQSADLMSVCKELHQTKVCQEVLSHLCVFDQKQSFCIDLTALIAMFPNTQSLWIDMGHSNKIKFRDCVKDNFIRYMRSSHSNSKKKNKFLRIEFRKLSSKQKKVLTQIKSNIQESKWNIYIDNDGSSKSVLFLYGSNVNDSATNWKAVK